jgi:hypothetical protein
MSKPKYVRKIIAIRVIEARTSFLAIGNGAQDGISRLSGDFFGETARGAFAIVGPAMESVMASMGMQGALKPSAGL